VLQALVKAIDSGSDHLYTRVQSYIGIVLCHISFHNHFPLCISLYFTIIRTPTDVHLVITNYCTIGHWVKRRVTF
jgi:hypothetical protein